MKYSGYISFVLLLICSFAGFGQTLILGVSERHESGLDRPGEYRLAWQLTQQVLGDNQEFKLTLQSMPWAWSQSQLQQGKLDALFFAAITPEREQWAQFTAPLAISRAGFFRLSSQPFASAEQIRTSDLLVGVIEGSAQSQFLRDSGYNNLYGLVESDALLQLLKGGRVKHIFIVETLARYYCSDKSGRRQNLCLEAGDMPMEAGIHIMGRQGNANFGRFTRALNKGLNKLVSEDRVWPLFEQNGLSRLSYQKWQQILDRQMALSP
ncbi:substrate-binding periplasmic protein [Bowmanella denitrificans]|uniref:substrate-binding periplasmic protein n=1 Tax=Bowmanella denitrificans TaxID=366582 RepID=UPI000C9A2A6F|nr:transporter substrate-binding domain-containing protein [Bowmanella denitrificans]